MFLLICCYQGMIFFRPFFLLLDSFWDFVSVAAGVAATSDLVSSVALEPSPTGGGVRHRQHPGPGCGEPASRGAAGGSVGRTCIYVFAPPPEYRYGLLLSGAHRSRQYCSFLWSFPDRTIGAI